MAVPYDDNVVVVVALFGAVEEEEGMYYEVLLQFVLLGNLNHPQTGTEISIASVCSVQNLELVVAAAEQWALVVFSTH